MDNLTFIQEKFAEFYREKSSIIQVPRLLEQREFGFLLFKENIMLRHKGFKTAEELKSFIMQIVPAHAYYSTAYYQAPEEKMEDKGWLGADIYFDIDADHIPTRCGKIHDRWRCRSCGLIGRGVTPPQCPICDGKSFDGKTWLCELCLESAKSEAMKLIDILREEFGCSSKDLEVSFSGHRGYHVHVENESAKELDSSARKELVDYIMGVGIDASFHGLIVSGSKRLRIISGPSVNDGGWRGRITKGLLNILASASEEELKEFGLSKKIITDILQARKGSMLLREGVEPWSLLRGISRKALDTLIKHAVEGEAAKIDTVVTTDIHRLIRMPNTLHGGTGLMKVSFPADMIEEFDPLKESVAFERGEVRVHVREAPKFRIGDEEFGPYSNVEVELPTAAALLILCKDAGSVA
ncbi:MAG: DNA primase small subunit PriS [Nitrososphaerota archaeon]|nr:DNA primase small subunit PriS [Candidatus Bathyarchaeota archaeon]MDW8049194.1 DNA primase small subunit PriS [Nitrososphaerota archaeon]